MLADFLDRGASTNLRKKGLAVDEDAVEIHEIPEIVLGSPILRASRSIRVTISTSPVPGKIEDRLQLLPAGSRRREAA